MTDHTRQLADAKAVLEQADQAHVLDGVDQLNEEQQEQLLEQIGEVDWPEVTRLVQSHVLNKPEFKLDADKLEPAPWYPFMPTADHAKQYDEARALGEKLIREGKVAAFCVAGGQGTRLGWDGPKGTYPATPVRKTSLFGVFAEYIRKVQAKYDTTVPFYVMTSPINHGPTMAFFREHNYFGLDDANVMFFSQQMMPAFDQTTGKVLMAGPSSIAMSPNGHGGSLKALYTSGAIADMQDRGIEQISYIQVDNPMVKVIDPLFIGLHAMDNAQMSSKMLPKAYGKEKLGNFCLLDGRMTVIEYSDLPDELAEQTLDDGSLRFRAGSIAIHAIRVDFVKQLNTAPQGFGLPWHRADKKVPYFDREAGKLVEPEEANAVKLETFVFDALPMCETSIIYETDRGEEFGPIKNAEGTDSPATSILLQTERDARWLTLAGVHIPRDKEARVDAAVEISPLAAIEASDVDKAKLPPRLEPGDQLVLD